MPPQDEETSDDRKSARHNLPAWFVLVTFVGIGGWIYWMANAGLVSHPPETVSQPPQSLKKTPTKLTVGLLNDGLELGIVNLDDFDWNDCEFGLNPHGFSGAGYSFHAQGLKAHSDGTLKLVAFTDDDGLLFDPGRRVVKLVSIVCDTPYGRLVAVEAPKYIGSQ